MSRWDLPAVVVDAGLFGLIGDAGEQLGLVEQERRPLGGADDGGDPGAGVAALFGGLVQEVGDVAGGDPVVGVVELALVGLRVARVVAEVVVLGVVVLGVVVLGVVVLVPVTVHVVLLSRSRVVTVLACLRWLERSR